MVKWKNLAVALLVLLLWFSSAAVGKKIGPCVCMAYGDPHFQTCDGLKFEFQGGTCSYNMMSSCNLIPGIDDDLVTFSVTIKNSEAESGEQTTSVHEIIIQFNGILIIMASHGGVTVNDASISMSSGPNVFNGYNLTRIVDGQINRLETDFGLAVLVKLPIAGNKHRIRVKIHRRYRKKVCGLCGNYDGRMGNDMRTANGTNLKRLSRKNRVKAFAELGKSHMVQSFIEEPCEDVIPTLHEHLKLENMLHEVDPTACQGVDSTLLAQAEYLCQIRKRRSPVKRIFSRCLRQLRNPVHHINVTEFEDGCVSAFCSGLTRSKRNAQRQVCYFVQALGEVCRDIQRRSEGWCEVLNCPAKPELGCHKWEPYLARYAGIPFV
ncbi:mucin-6 isoform X1 [Lingula anatina]|uniref:Mucin-6 isoform X1 n=1 Tax=Lingula anatina TaxID=7574 RepID=A0A1S3ISV6_LINAN|nr:mucin-6 isoform X1 [Lingula anatina]|eukprot:XP_013401158.1 mucin-6 isoform X1 [Lingula anatina]